MVYNVIILLIICIKQEGSYKQQQDICIGVFDPELLEFFLILRDHIYIKISAGTLYLVIKSKVM